MPEFLRILMRKVTPTSIIDIDREIFVLIGNVWCVFRSDGFEGGLAKPGAPHVRVIYGQQSKPAVALLLSRRTGRLTGMSAYAGLPFRYFVKVGFERICNTDSKELKHYGLLYSRHAEGFYWGDKEFQYGDPSLERLLWDDSHEPKPKDLQDV